MTHSRTSFALLKLAYDATADSVAATSWLIDEELLADNVTNISFRLTTKKGPADRISQARNELKARCRTLRLVSPPSDRIVRKRQFPIRDDLSAKTF